MFMSPRERLVRTVQELEHLEQLKQYASDQLKEGFEKAAAEGYDKDTLKVVLKLRKMTPEQRRERKALEAIYMSTLGMLEGDALPESARRRMDEQLREVEPPPPPKDQPADETAETNAQQPDPALEHAPAPARQPPLVLKEPEEARQEGAAAAAAGKRIYDNPYPAGDPCRAAWDEGWCAQQQSHGMDTPAAYKRRGEAPKKDEKHGKDAGGDGHGDAEEGAA